MPSTIYIALVTIEPTTASTGSTISEPPSGVGYSRQSYSMNSLNWTASSSGHIKNINAVIFTTQTTGIWGTLVAWVACTGSSAGEVLYWGSLDTAMYVDTGALISLPAGSMEVSVEPPSAR
jgi:hypothetical protein